MSTGTGPDPSLSAAVKANGEYIEAIDRAIKELESAVEELKALMVDTRERLEYLEYLRSHT